MSTNITEFFLIGSLIENYYKVYFIKSFQLPIFMFSKLLT